MSTENEASEPYEEPTVPQYQIQLENLDYELKKLKANLFLLEEEHSGKEIRIKSKIDSAKKALEKPLRDLEKAKNNDSSLKGEETNKLKEELNLIAKKKEENAEKIQKLEENLGPKIAEQNLKYERMSMLENDIQSTEVEKKRLEKEIPTLDKKTEQIIKTYPESFKKLTDDFILFDKKSRIEVNIKEIENKIILQNYKVKEFQEIKSHFDELTSEKEGNAGDIELKLKLNEEKQNEINTLVNSLGQGVNQIIQIEKYFNMFDALFQNKDYINNKIPENTIKNTIMPFINDLFENYSEMNNNQLDVIDEYQKEIDDLNDIKPASMQIKKDLKLKENKIKEEKNFSEYLQKLVNICQNLKESKWALATGPMDISEEQNFYEKLKEMISLSAESSKEEVEKQFDEYLELKEEKAREYFYLVGGSSNANDEFNQIKEQANGYNDIITRHKNEIDNLIKEKKLLQNELKALNDTINLRSRELRNSLSKFTEEEFTDYFNINKALLKLVLFKEKKSIVKNNQYELSKENIHENVLEDHSRKKTNMYTYLKRKYLLEYLCHIYTEDNLDFKDMNERTKKAFEELSSEISNLFKEIDTYKEEINNCDDKINAKKSEINDTNF